MSRIPELTLIEGGKKISSQNFILDQAEAERARQLRLNLIRNPFKPGGLQRLLEAISPVRKGGAGK